jgi:hypothetical protein
VLRLREHYRLGQPAQTLEEHGHYLDLVSYWREECRKAQVECDRLQSINIRLERSEHQLSQRASTILNGGHPHIVNNERPSTAIVARPNTAINARPSTATNAKPSTANNVAKRKAHASPTRPSKRPRASIVKVSEQSIAQIQDGIESDFEFLEGLGDGKQSCIDDLMQKF